MPNLNPREVAKALVVRLRAIQALRSSLLASTDLSVDQKLNFALRLSAARTNLVELANGLLFEGTPGTRYKTGGDSGAVGSPGTDAPAVDADSTKILGKTTQSAAPARVLARMDAVTEAVEALNEDLDTEHELRAITAAKDAIRDNKNLDPELKLRQYLTADDAHEHLREAAARRRKKKTTAPDQTARVPKHDHARDPNGKVDHAGALDPKAAADAEARLSRHARALV